MRAGVGHSPPIKGGLGKHLDSNSALLPGCVARGKELDLSEPWWDDKGPGDPSSYTTRSAHS